MQKLIFLEIWKMNNCWGTAKATNHRGTFAYGLVDQHGFQAPRWACSLVVYWPSMVQTAQMIALACKTGRHNGLVFGL